MKKMNFSNCSKDFQFYDATLPEINEVFSGADIKKVIKNKFQQINFLKSIDNEKISIISYTT